MTEDKKKRPFQSRYQGHQKEAGNTSWKEGFDELFTVRIVADRFEITSEKAFF